MTERQCFRLTPFEEYMLFDDRREWPMTFWVRLQFGEPMETARLSRAMLATSAQNPLLSARVVYDPQQRPFWAPAEPKGDIRFFPSTPLDMTPPTSDPFNLACEPSWRIWKSSTKDDPTIWIEFHHSACDGVGAFRAIDHLLRHYLDDSYSRPVADGAAWNQAARRDSCCALSYNDGPVGQWFRLMWRTIHYLTTRPSSLDEVTSPDCKRGFLESSNATEEQAICTRGSIDELHQAAHQSQCTINDLVLREWFAALRDLFERRCPNKRHRIRLFVPMNLRGKQQDQCEVCNVVGMMNIDRVVGPGIDEPLSLSRIAEEMSKCRQDRMGMAFVLSLEAVRRLLGSTRLLLSAQRCGATSVFTNLKTPMCDSPLLASDGRVHVGSNILQTIAILPPVRPMTPVTVAMWSYADKFNLCLRFHPKGIRRVDAEFLLGRLAERVTNQFSEKSGIHNRSRC